VFGSTQNLGIFLTRDLSSNQDFPVRLHICIAPQDRARYSKGTVTSNNNPYRWKADHYSQGVLDLKKVRVETTQSNT